MKSIRQKIARAIIRYSFDFAVTIIITFSRMKPYNELVDSLREYKDGTLGKAIADCLDEKGLHLVPKFESHDLKHVLLDYKMDPEGEIRLQAFMVGNGNVSLPSLAILTFGSLLLPSKWKLLFSDYKKGQNTIPVSGWNIEEHGQQNLRALQHQITPTSTEVSPIFNTIKLTKIGAYSAVTAGVLGMFVCLPFLFSSNIADLIGAGFPFIGGAILSVGGLLALSNLSRKIPVV
jgi:hypothetical protein